MHLHLQNHTARHRYECDDGGRLVGYCEYNLLNDSIMVTHTEVLPGNESQGVGSFIAKGVLEDVQERGLFVIPACQFIAQHIRKHREAYIAIVKPQTQAAYKI